MRAKTFRYWLTVFSGIIWLFVLPCAAQQNISAGIDRYVKAEMQMQKIPGISLAVLRAGKIVFLKSYGLANIEHLVPVKPETVFQSGSIGKQFTAAAVMILVEEGKLALDDKITKYFADAPEAWKNITVRNLLNHTSGMGDYPPEVDLRRDYSEDEYLAIIKKTPLAFEPGTRWDYSNAGYFTLGALVRRVTGKFYGDFLQERIFKPLDMRTARIISESDIIPNRAAGYRLENGVLKNQEWVSPSTNTTADGSLYFTILDLAKWDAALYTDQPLKQSTLAQIWTPVKLNDGSEKAYGFGWHTVEFKGRRLIYHGGAWQGFKSFIGRFPDDKLTIIFFANSWDTKEFKLARGLTALFYREFAPPAAPPIEDKEPQTTLLVRRVLLQFSKSAADLNLFTPEAAAEIFPARAKQIGEKLTSLSIPVAVIYTNELIERRAEDNFRVYRYFLNDVTRTFSCTVKLTKDGKIADFQLEEIK
ncbi:MAG TPA: serine hydrolase domain-containing protein [Pyrinomonadaceae bacterium]|nr:serine hydrolase domain-containing protein [Pyrinomonadaceae bacterium]